MEMEKERLFSLDLLRELDMFLPFVIIIRRKLKART